MSIIMSTCLFGVSDQVQHKLFCVATGANQRLEALDIGTRYMSLVVRKPAFCICENKAADQL